jgi:hypothetical protein
VTAFICWIFLISFRNCGLGFLLSVFLFNKGSDYRNLRPLVPQECTYSAPGGTILFKFKPWQLASRARILEFEIPSFEDSRTCVS